MKQNTSVGSQRRTWCRNTKDMWPKAFKLFMFIEFPDTKENSVISEGETNP